MKALTNNEIAKAIYFSTKGKTGTSLSENLKGVVKFLSRRGLISKRKVILNIFKNIINQEEGILSVKVTSSSNLGHEAKKDLEHLLKKRYSAKDVALEEVLDERLLGGMKLEINDEVIDLTIKNKIGQLQEYLIRN